MFNSVFKSIKIELFLEKFDSLKLKDRSRNSITSYKNPKTGGSFNPVIDSGKSFSNIPIIF